MEKLVYLLWPKPSEAEPGNAFREALLSGLPGRLHALGVRQLKISVTDADVAAGAALHLGAEAPRALVSFWLECARERGPVEMLLRRASARLAGYLVAESQPLILPPDRTDPASGRASGTTATSTSTSIAERGRRSPGFSLVGGIEPAEGVSKETFFEIWESRHVQVAIETQSTFSYVRNEVARALTPDAPPWLGVVEEGFPVEALSDPRAFYDVFDAPSPDEATKRFNRNLKRMVDSCAAFLSLEKVDSHPMSEYRFF